MKDRFRGICECGDHAWAVCTRGYVALVSPEDADLIKGVRWTTHIRGEHGEYAVPKRERVGYLPRVIVPCSPAEEVDHINRWGMDNRRRNLRACSHGENMCNTVPRQRRRRRSSVYKGVSVKMDGSITAQIARRHKIYHLGTFTTEEHAAAAYDVAAVALHGSFARTNRSMGLLP
jgi:hypothetical protein